MKTGVTLASLRLLGNIFFEIIQFVTFAIGCDIILDASFNILGGSESTPVAFLGFNELRCYLISFSVTCFKLKFSLFDWLFDIFDMLGCWSFTGVLLLIPILSAMFT